MPRKPTRFCGATALRIVSKFPGSATLPYISLVLNGLIKVLSKNPSIKGSFQSGVSRFGNELNLRIFLLGIIAARKK